MRICVAMLALVACQGSGSPSKPAQGHETTPAAGSAAKAEPDMIDTRCPVQKFAESTPLPEASGAAWLTIDGTLALVVVADSGNHGAYAVIDPETGDTREQGTLPLGKQGDDLEGLAARGDKLYGLTSDGWLRVWQRSGKTFTLVDGPYPIGSTTKLNYEGLAVAATPKGCAGFACSKADGRLYCLTEQAGRFAVDPQRTIEVTRKGALGDCAFDDKDVLWVGGNLFGLNRVFRIDGWAEPLSAKAVTTNAFGVGNSEVIAVRDGVIYRMSDNNGTPSLMAKFRCSPSTR